MCCIWTRTLQYLWGFFVPVGACPILVPENTLYFVALLVESVTVPEGVVPSPGAVDDLLPELLNS